LNPDPFYLAVNEHLTSISRECKHW